MRIIYAGTPITAVPPLQALIDSAHEVAAVVTRPPARAGRGRKLVPSPVATLAAEHGIPVIEASHMRDEETRHAIAQVNAELGVVVAYGALIPPVVLEMPERGWVNLHFSDLPRWRGAAPVQRAIMAGDATTASCIFQLEKGLDTGPVFSRLPVVISPTDTTDSLLESMALAGGQQIVDLIDAMEQGSAQSVAQNTGVDGQNITHAPMLQAAQGFVSFENSVLQTDCHIRAFTSNPGAWTTLPDGKRLKLSAARPAHNDELIQCGVPENASPGTVCVAKKHVVVACSDGWLCLGQVAPAGKGWMDASAWARGARLTQGDRLGAPTAETSNTDGQVK